MERGASVRRPKLKAWTMSTPIFTRSDDLKSGARRRERRSSCILRQETSGTESPAHRRVRHPPPQRIKDPFSALGFMVQKKVGLVCFVMVWDWLGLPCFRDFPVFSRAGMQFESHLGHTFSARLGPLRPLARLTVSTSCRRWLGWRPQAV